MPLMLKTLRGDQTLDAGGFGVGFLVFAFRLDFTADDEFADLFASPSALYLPHQHRKPHREHSQNKHGSERERQTSSSLVNPKNFLIFVARFGPNRFGCTVSVNPGSSSSPCLMILSANTAKSMATIHPLTLFLLRSPVLLGL